MHGISEDPAAGLFSPTQPQLLLPGSVLLCHILLQSGTLTVPNVHQGSLLLTRPSASTLTQGSTCRRSLFHPLLPLLISNCTKPLWSPSDSFHRSHLPHNQPSTSLLTLPLWILAIAIILFLSISKYSRNTSIDVVVSLETIHCFLIFFLPQC